MVPAQPVTEPTTRPSLRRAPTSRWTPDAILAPTAEPTQPPVTPPAVPTPRVPNDDVASGRYLDVALAFDGEMALDFVRDLTDLAYAGRQGGAPESLGAAEYIAARFEEYGLQPAGVEGYMQPVPLPYARLTAMPSLTITRADGMVDTAWVYREHWAPLWQGYAGGGVAEGEVYWLGDGSAEAYHGLDVCGEIVLVSGMPDDGTIRRAVEHGADGMLLLTTDPRRVTIQRTYRAAPYLPESFPVLGITSEAVERLLEGGNYTRGDLSILFESVPLGTRARFEIPMDEPGMAWGRNVVGALPGADPDVCDQVIVLGGHWDHVGLDANGDHYAGANDNASGVAVLIELARLWHAVGYTPDRTVVFAAWDGEEQGLLGARYYVEHPIYPIEDTVGMVQLDMVGLATDGVMAIDGLESHVVTVNAPLGPPTAENRVSEQMAVSAALIDVPTTRTLFQGRSDHEPFLHVRVPATLLIWDNGQVPYYHTPQDTWDTLEPLRLRQSGVMLAHTAMSLASDVPGILTMLKAQWDAMQVGDREAYLATFDPEDALLRASAAQRFDALSIDARAAHTATLRHLHVGDRAASMELVLGEVKGRAVQQSAVVPGTMVRRGETWYASWPQRRVVTTTHLVAQVVAPMAVLPQGALDTIQPTNRRAEDDLRIERLSSTYDRVCELLGIEAPPAARLTILPDEAALDWWRQGAVASDDGDDLSPFVGSVVAGSAPLTDTSASLLLETWGLPDARGDWLREGLIAWLDAGASLDGAADSDGREAHWRHMRRLDADIDPLAVLDDEAREPAGRGLSDAETAVAYSLVAGLLNERGAAGIEAFCAAWAEGGEANAYAALDTTREAFAASWRTEGLDPILAARQGLNDWAEARRGAVAEGDEVAFFATLTPGEGDAERALRIGQRNWFADLLADPVARHDLEVEPVSITQEGEALADVSETIHASGGAYMRSRAMMRFESDEEGWRLLGPRWAVSRTERVTLHQPDEGQASAVAVEDVADLYDEVCTALGIDETEELIVEVYASADALRADTGVSLAERAVGWAAPRVLSEDIVLVRVVCDRTTKDEPLERQALLAEWIGRALLDRLGADAYGEPDLPEWTREAVALHLAARVRGDDLLATRYAAEMRAAREAARLDRLFDWGDPPDLDDLSPTEAELWRGQTLALVHWLVDDWGGEALAPFVRALAAGEPVVEAFSAATRSSFAAWQPVLEGRLANGGIPNELLGAARRFDVDRAFATVSSLTAPEMAGRRAGSPGAERAAAWLEDAMRDLGLAPGIVNTEYIHEVKVSFGELTAAPSLDVVSSDGARSLSLAYPLEFRELVGAAAGGGDTGEGVELAWLPHGFPNGTDADPKAAMDLGGRVAVLLGERGQVGIAERAIAHGAGGVILVVSHYDPAVRELFTARTYAATVPLVQIREDTLRRVLALAGITLAEAYNGPPVLLTGLQVRLNVPYEAKREAVARNVIGVLPGSDPEAPALVLAAHYDGVGDQPDGTRYPGANIGVSGVATLLEMARLWTESGRQPSRPIYFVALGAEEVGEASSAAWARDGILPPEDVEMLLLADTVGRARSYWLEVDASAGRHGSVDPEALVRRMMLAGELLERRIDQGSAPAGGTHSLLRRCGYPVTVMHWPSAPAVHTPDDTVEKLDPAKMATAGETLMLTTLMLAP